jgi:hypothetical protein
MSFRELLSQTRAQALARPADPWQLRLERARGKLGDDDVERVSTQALFDLLEIPQKTRTASACRRVAKLMRELAWVVAD